MNLNTNNLIWLLIVSAFFSCKYHVKEKSIIEDQVKEFSGKSIVFSDSLILISRGESMFFYEANTQAKNKKVLTIINGECNSCIDEILMWDEFYMTMIDKTKKNDLYFVILNVNLENFLKVYFDELPYYFNFIIDENNHFIQDNNLHRLSISNTLFLNELNIVTFIGSPVNNSKIFNIYIDNLQ
jgi:hypothetical protein